MRTLNLPMAILFLAVFSTPQALAVVDPDPDGIGVYFDLSADHYTLWQLPSVPFNAHIILTNPTAEEIGGFELAYHLEIEPGTQGLIFRLQALSDFLPIDPALPITDIFDDEIIVGPFDLIPMPPGPAVILVTWQFMILAPNVWIEFYLGPTSGDGDTNGQLAYFSELGPTPMHVSSGNFEYFLASINRDGVVPISEKTFGSLKALFR